MKKLIAISTAFACIFAISAQAAKPDRGNANTRKPAAKPKAVAPKQQQQRVAPQQQRTAPKTNVENKAPKKERATDAVTNVESKKLKTDKAPKLDKRVAPDAATNVIGDDKLRKNATTNVNANRVTVNKESVARIQAQHRNFQARPNTAITTARYNPAYRIAAANNWVGPRYEVFRTYQPQWHDRNYWTSNFARVSLIAGGWYYFNNGYWAPAWGYDESAAYYPYDGPIYAGPSGRPHDQVVADVQAVLQEQGFYKGEVDGLVGPQTREALAAYQAAAGLPATASIDEPTLESLGLT